MPICFLVKWILTLKIRKWEDGIMSKNVCYTSMKTKFKSPRPCKMLGVAMHLACTHRTIREEVETENLLRLVGC